MVTGVTTAVTDPERRNMRLRRKLVIGAAVLAAAGAIAAGPTDRGNGGMPPLPAQAQAKFDQLANAGAFRPGGPALMGRPDPATGRDEVDPATGQRKLFTWDELHPGAYAPPPAGTPYYDKDHNVIGYSDGTK